MNIEQINANLVIVTLSRTNLKKLMDKLDENGSHTITRLTESNVRLVVTAEEDDDHYSERPDNHHPKVRYAQPY